MEKIGQLTELEKRKLHDNLVKTQQKKTFSCSQDLNQCIAKKVEQFKNQCKKGEIPYVSFVTEYTEGQKVPFTEFGGIYCKKIPKLPK